MFEVNDIPPIDSWALQDLIAENVQHEEFLFFRINHRDDLDWILGEADDTSAFALRVSSILLRTARAALRPTGIPAHGAGHGSRRADGTAARRNSSH